MPKIGRLMVLASLFVFTANSYALPIFSRNIKRVVSSEFESQFGFPIDVDFVLTRFGDLYYRARYPRRYVVSKWWPWSVNLEGTTRYKLRGKDDARRWTHEYEFLDIFKRKDRVFVIVKEEDAPRRDAQKFLAEIKLTDAPTQSLRAYISYLGTGLVALTSGGYVALGPMPHNWILSTISVCLMGAGAELVHMGLRGLTGHTCGVVPSPRAADVWRSPDGYRFRVVHSTPGMGQIQDVMLQTNQESTRMRGLAQILENRSCEESLRGIRGS